MHKHVDKPTHNIYLKNLVNINLINIKALL